jgi:hypothetical protein
MRPNLKLLAREASMEAIVAVAEEDVPVAAVIVAAAEIVGHRPLTTGCVYKRGIWQQIPRFFFDLGYRHVNIVECL